jgi:hypothetical protein
MDELEDHVLVAAAMMRMLGPTITDPALLEQEHEAALRAQMALEDLYGMLRRPEALRRDAATMKGRPGRT